MPMIALFPWCNASKELQVGDFVIAPFGLVLQQHQVPTSLADAVTKVLISYGHRRPVDRAHVPLLRTRNATFLDDLNDEQIGVYYGARTTLAFAALSARDYFGHRYWNSDSLRMDIRAFSEHSSGAIVVDRRRRDGYQTVMYAGQTYVERRPDHVNACNLSRDLDGAIFRALWQPLRRSRIAAQLQEAISVFVRANSDSPAVDPQSELIDTISAFSRLVNAHKAAAVVDGVVRLVPDRILRDDRGKSLQNGPKTANASVRHAVTGANSLRSVWLHDAFKLRHQYGHGRVMQTEFMPIWTLNEHLLLSAWIFPIAVKSLLVLEGVYEMSWEDRFRNWAFDVLLTVDAFKPAIPPHRQVGGTTTDATSGLNVDEDAEPKSQWRATVEDLQMRFAGEEIRRNWISESDSDGA